MKKLGLIVLVAGIILMAGCAGDDPSGPGGTLPTVTGLEVLTTSSGVTVNLSWTAVSGTTIDGYEVYFKSDGEGEWGTAITTVTETTYSHTADNAGTYSVRAYDGDNYSENYAIDVTTMPTFISPLYTIWNNHAPADEHSGIIFGATAATTGLAGSTSFDQDIYCYDGEQGSYTWFYSGDHAPFGNGSHTDMYEHASNFAYPTGSAWEAGAMVVGDVIFAELSNGHYIKIYVDALPHYEGGTSNAYGITLYYDYQPIQGLYLFSTDAS